MKKSTLFASFALWTFAPALAPAAPTKPNIIVIMSDDMGYSDLGCYGSEIERTSFFLQKC